MSVPTAYLATDLDGMIDDFPTEGSYQGQALTCTVSEAIEHTLQGDGSMRPQVVLDIVFPASQVVANIPAPDRVIRIRQQDHVILSARRSDDGVSWLVRARQARSRGG